ncbi:MAG: hypothetical protein PHO07_21450 [Pirellulales bacterium]|jgi:hypothetical protein|nr:hypothetical protein [Pirellulales bacterium]
METPDLEPCSNGKLHTDANGLGRGGPEQIPARYNDRSELEAKVENDSERFDFDLKTVAP